MSTGPNTSEDDEPDPRATDSYRSSTRRGEFREDWTRSLGGIQTQMFLERRGSLGIDVTIKTGNSFSSDAPRLVIETSHLLSLSDMIHLREALSRYIEEAEQREREEGEQE